MPRPPCSSGTSSPGTPISASFPQNSGERPVSVSHMAAHMLDGALADEEVAHGLLQQPLVFGEVELHDARRHRTVFSYFRGMPRMRSAMMLRWISFVPA